MSRPLTVACVQMTSGDDMAANVSAISELVGKAAGEGATLVGLPENCLLMTAPGEFLNFPAYDFEAHPGIDACRDVAAREGVHLLLGSVAVTGGAEGKRLNRSIMIAPDGSVTATYDKMHLFDVSMPNGESHRESARFAPGARATLTAAGPAKVGMTICYDLRFPHLFRALAQAGAEVMAVPAAFTYVTGVAHWHVLLRARAIETGSFVMAPAQVGQHPGGRRTYGHALIVDSWGTVLADAGAEEIGVATATIDLDKVAEMRGIIPNLALERAITVDCSPTRDS